MEKDITTQCKDVRNLRAEKQLSKINLFFSAYGNFLNGIFCISQYYFFGKRLFEIIPLGIAVLIVSVTYGISYSKASLRNEKFWKYTELCAEKIGPCNPIFLLLGLILALNASRMTVALWILMEIVQISCYLFVLKKNFPDTGKVLIQKIRKWTKCNIAFLITSLLSLSFGWLWFISPEGNRYADLWLNLSAGFIASSITISVIDRILKKQRELNEQPLRQAMYRDIQLFTSRFISLWREMYLQSVSERRNMTIEDFFAPSSIEIIRNHLDLSSQPNVYPRQTWFSYLENASRDLIDRGQKILTTYLSFADPEVLQAVHYLINDSAYLGYLLPITQIHSFDVLEHIPRPTLLAYYTIEPGEMDSKMAAQLFNWCNTQYEKLHEAADDDQIRIMPISNQLDLSTNTTTPGSAITEEKISKMVSEYHKWQQSHATSTE